MAAKPIIVVGAGIAGLALAAALRRAARPVLVLEAAPQLAAEGAGISLWPNALAALDAIGLGDGVRAAGWPMAAGGLRSATGRWLRRIDQQRFTATLGEPVTVIQRADLLALLAKAVDPITIRRAATVTRVSGVATVTLSDGTAIDGAAVVGADGIGSVIAQSLDGRLSRRYAGYTAWRGIAETAPDTEPSQTWGPDGEFGFLPMGANRTYWFATQRTAPGGRAPDGELPLLCRTFATWHAPIGSLLAATDPAEVLRHDVYDRPTACRWSVGPVTLIGDAAHPMRPHLGQGGCQALVDAAVLANLIETTDHLCEAFTRFAACRRRPVHRVVRASALLGQAIHTRGALRPLTQQLAALTPNAVVLPYTASIAGRGAFFRGQPDYR